MRNAALFLTFILLSGCGQDSGPNVQTVSDCNTAPTRQLMSEKKAVKIAKSVDGIDDATALYVDDHLSLAVKSSNLNMFKIETLEKEVFSKLKKQFPKSNIFVSDDMKYYEKIDKMSKKTWPKSKTAGCKQLNDVKKLQSKLQD